MYICVFIYIYINLACCLARKFLSSFKNSGIILRSVIGPSAHNNNNKIKRIFLATIGQIVLLLSQICKTGVYFFMRKITPFWLVLFLKETTKKDLKFLDTFLSFWIRSIEKLSFNGYFFFKETSLKQVN